MALEQTAQLPLEELLNLFLNQELTIEEFLIDCQRYPALWSRIEPLLATLPLVSRPEEARELLLKQVVLPFLDTKQTPPQIRRQLPNEAIPMTEVIQRSEDLKKILRREFASQLVENFMKQTKNQIGKDKLLVVLDSTVNQLIDHPRQHPELALTIAAELAAQNPGIAAKKAAAAAVSHALTLEVLAGGVNDSRLAGLHTFFQANARGVQQLVAPVGDFVFRMLPHQWRIEIIEDQIAKSFERVAKKLERAGGVIADSPVFASYLSRAQQYQQEQVSASVGVAKLRNAALDVITTVFGSPDHNVEVIYEAGKAARLVFAVERWEQLPLLNIHYAGIAQKAPNLFRLALSEAGSWGISYAAKKGAAAAGEKLAGTALGRILGGLFGSAGGPLGAIVGSVVLDRALTFVGGIFKGVFSFFSGEFFSRLLAGTKTDWKTDLPLLLAGGAVGAIVLLFVFPWFMNPQFMYDLATKTPLAVNVQKKIGSGTEPGIDCEKIPDAPECKLTQCQGDCRWPLDIPTRFCISEGPFVGTHSLSHLSAVDFLTTGTQRSLFGANVYSQYAGTVERAVFGYPDDSGYPGNNDGGTYGNHVVIRTNNGGRLLFAHLRNIQIAHEGESVPAGKMIGFVDHTGYSYDVHLHYEDWSGDINRFLPFPVPPCKSVRDCDMKLKPAGHAACQ